VEQFLRYHIRFYIVVLNYVQDLLTSMSVVGVLTTVVTLSTAVQTQDSQINVPLGMVVTYVFRNLHVT
jgi:hypothetical protein